MQRLGDVLHDNQGIAAISQVHFPWRDVAAFNVTQTNKTADVGRLQIHANSHPPWH